VGLPAAFNAFVTARVRTVAATVGAPLEKNQRCKGNIAIVFSDAPQAFMNGVAANYPGVLGYHAASQTRKLATVTHTIQAWYGTMTRTAFGQQSIDDLLARPIGSSDLAQGPMGRKIVRVDDSRIANGLGASFGITLVVADAGKVANQEIGGVADYVALLALSQPASLDGCNALPSIIDLLSPACDGRPRPTALTESDFAFLKALYATSGENSASMAKGNIVAHMAAAEAGGTN
jgi:hypothetical protein